MGLRLVEPDVVAVWPRAEGRRVVFLLDARGPTERQMLLEWVQQHRPEDARYRVAELPTSRRIGRSGLSSNLRSMLEGDDDPLLQPLRVAWLAPKREGRRTVSFRDLLLFGDPREPGPLRRAWIRRFRPDRIRVVAAEPAPASDLRRRWVEARTRSPEDPFGFVEFVALQASLALERAERRIRGNRYKVPRFLAQDLTTRSQFQMGVLRLSEQLEEEPAETSRRAMRSLKEIAATHSTFVIDLVANLTRVLYQMGYQRSIRYERADLERLAALSQQHSLVFLPSHKSQLDHLVLFYLLYENGLPPNHTAGGVNLNFFPVGPLVRRAGVFFIRRSFKDDPVYKYVLKQYLDYLLSKRFPLEWFMEGGRSRSGKLRAPRYGLLSYVVDSYRRGACDDAVLVPVAIAYDQIQDIGAYTAEQRGEAKEKESFSWMVKAINSLRRRYGRISVRFGDPLFLSERVATYTPGAEGDPDAAGLEVRKLAFEVGARINRVTPITPISLVALALLGARDRALTVPELIDALDDYVADVERRRLPTTEPLQLGEAAGVEAALEALREHGVVSRFDGPETVYSIEPEQHLAAAYYRNTIIHFFLAGSLAEIGLVAAAEQSDDRVGIFWREVWRLRDLLKFEFYLSERDDFATEIHGEVGSVRADWESALGEGREAVMDLLDGIRPFTAPAVLRPFLEAYRVVADALELRDYRRPVEQREFLADCLALGEQYRLQRRIESPESVSAVLFETAAALAGHRGLLEPGGPEVLERRREFAAEIREAIRRIDAVEALAAARRAGIG